MSDNITIVRASIAVRVNVKVEAPKGSGNIIALHLRQTKTKDGIHWKISSCCMKPVCKESTNYIARRQRLTFKMPDTTRNLQDLSPLKLT